MPICLWENIQQNLRPKTTFRILSLAQLLLLVVSMKTLIVFFTFFLAATSYALPLASVMEGSDSHQTSFRELLRSTGEQLSLQFGDEDIYIAATEADGRSLQSEYDTAEFKRKSVSFTSESGVPLLFVGYAPKAHSAEWISWDPIERRYIAQISHDVGPEADEPLVIESINANMCNSCHHTPRIDPKSETSMALIFSSFPWAEQIGDPNEKRNILKAHKKGESLFSYSNLNMAENTSVDNFVFGNTDKSSRDNSGHVTLSRVQDFDVAVRQAQQIQNDARICESICLDNENCIQNLLSYILLINSNIAITDKALSDHLEMSYQNILMQASNYQSSNYSYPSGVLSNYNPYVLSLARGTPRLKTQEGEVLTYSEKFAVGPNAENNHEYEKVKVGSKKMIGLNNFLDANGNTVLNFNNPLNLRPNLAGPELVEFLGTYSKVRSQIRNGDSTNLELDTLSFSCFGITPIEMKKWLSEAATDTNQLISEIQATDFSGALENSWPLSRNEVKMLISQNLDIAQLSPKKDRDLWRQAFSKSPLTEESTPQQILTDEDVYNSLQISCAGCHASESGSESGIPPFMFLLNPFSDDTISEIKDYRSYQNQSIAGRLELQEMPPPSSEEAHKLAEPLRSKIVDYLRKERPIN